MIFGYKIEGVGPSDPSINRRLRFASDLLEDDPDGLYRATLLREGFSSVESAVDFRGGPSQTGGVSFGILLDAETLYTFGRTRENVDATVVSQITSYATTSIGFDREDLEGLVRFIGREAILIGTHTGGGSYNGCTRGYRSTLATSHLEDRSVFRTMHPSTLYGRTVTFFMVEDGGGYDDEVTLQQFVIQEATLSPERGTTAIHLECLGVLDVLRLSKPAPYQWRGRVRSWNYSEDAISDALFDLPGWAMDPEDVPGVVSLREPSGDITNFAVQVGERVYRAEYVAGETYQYDFGSPLYAAVAELPEFDAPVRQVWPVDPSVPAGSGLGYQGSTFRGDAITVALNLLLSQPGAESEYSVGVDFGLRLPEVPLDVAYCEQLRAVLGNELRVPNFVWGLSGDEKTLTLDLLEAKLLIPFQLALGPGPSGGLAIVRLFDAAPVFEPTTSVDNTNLRMEERIGESLGWDSTVSEVTATYDSRPGVGSRTATAYDARLRSRRLGKAGEISLDLGAVTDVETVQNALGDFGGRWRNPTPTLSFALHPSSLLHLGQGADLSSPGVLGWSFDHGGYPQEGVRDSRIVITSRRLGLDRNTYQALHVGLRYNRTGRRSSSAEIISYDDPTKTLTISLQSYVRDGHPTYDADIESFEVGDIIQWRSGADGTLVVGGLEIVALTAPDQVELAVSPGALVPGAGDVILNDVYDDSTESQTGRHAYYANTDGTVGSGFDSGYQYQG